MLLGLLTAIALAGFPAAPKARHAISAWSVDGADLCFASGLRVVSVRRSGSGLVQLTTVVQGGLSAEGQGQEGAAWALTGLRAWSQPDEGIPLAVSGLGTRSEARALPEAVVSHTVAPAQDLQAVVAREARWLVDPLAGIDADTLEQARPHLEARGWAGQIEDQYAGSHQLRRMIYPEGHPARSLALPGAVRTLSLEELEAYAAATHVPSNMTLRLEGDVPTDVNALGTLLSGVLPDAMFRGSAPCDRAAEPDRFTPSPGPMTTVRAPVGQPQLHLGWHVPTTFSPDDLWLDRFADVVWIAMRSGVDFLLSERHRAAWLWSGCSVEPGARSSLLHCTFDLPTAEYAERASKALIRHIPNPVQSDELAVAFNALGLHGEAALPDEMARWDGQSLHQSIGRALTTHFGGHWQAAPSLSAVSQVDVRDMTRHAMDNVRPEDVAVTLLVPADMAEAGQAPSPSEPFLLTVGPQASITRPDVSGIVEHLSPSGLSQWIDSRPADQIALASARLAMPGGRFTEASPGVTAAWWSALRWRNVSQAALLERRSGTSGWREDLGWAWQVSGQATSANLDTLAWSLRHEIDVPFAYYEEQLQRAGIEREVEARLGSRATRVVPPYPELLSSAQRRGALLAGHPAGVPWWERFEAARSVSASALRDHAKQLMRPERGVLVVTSSEAPDQVMAVLDKYIDPWKGLPEPIKPAVSLSAGPPPGRQIRLYPSPAPIADVEVSCRLPGRTSTSRATLDGVAGGVRAVLTLQPSLVVRDVSVEPVDARVSLLVVSLAVAPAHAAHATRAVFTALTRLSRDLDEPTLESARLQAGLDHGSSLAGAAERSRTLAAFALEGFTPADVGAHADALAAVGAADLSRALADCVQHESVTVRGPVWPSTFTGVAEPVEVIDWRSELADIARGLD